MHNSWSNISELETSWWFQPIWKKHESQIGSSPQVGMNFKNLWNHHLGEDVEMWEIQTQRFVSLNMWLDRIVKFCPLNMTWQLVVTSVYSCTKKILQRFWVNRNIWTWNFVNTSSTWNLILRQIKRIASSQGGNKVICLRRSQTTCWIRHEST